MGSDARVDRLLGVMHAGAARMPAVPKHGLRNFCFSKIPLSLLQKLCSTPLRPAPTRGCFAVVTDVGCGMRWALSDRSMALPCRRTIVAHGEIAWSWPPDAEVKPAGVAETPPAGDGGKTARSPGRSRISRQTSRREGRVFGQTCGTCRLHFFPQAGHGRGQRPAFPAPSVTKRAVRGFKARAKCAARSRRLGTMDLGMMDGVRARWRGLRSRFSLSFAFAR
jgi:hypothetical protein